MLDFILSVFVGASGVIVGLALLLIVTFLMFWGAIDLYMMLRFRRKGIKKVDQTAIMGNWFALKWCLASQTDLVVEKLPFLSQDLSEVVGVKEDDGNVS